MGGTAIGDGAWIGVRGMIMPGVHIGEGAIVASGAIVTKNVAPYTIVAGNPAAFVHERFSKERIDLLLSLKIYSWSNQKMEALKHLLCSDNLTI